MEMFNFSLETELIGKATEVVNNNKAASAEIIFYKVALALFPIIAGEKGKEAKNINILCTVMEKRRQFSNNPGNLLVGVFFEDITTKTKAMNLKITGKVNTHSKAYDIHLEWLD